MTRQSTILPRQVEIAKKALKDEMAYRGIFSTDYIEWDTAFNIVKNEVRTKNWDQITEITKKTLSEIKSEELKQKHREYIETEKWKNRRKEKLEREDYTCEKCGATAEQAHHTTYRHFNSHDKEAEIRTLMAVCKDCHEKIEGKYNPKKLTERKGGYLGEGEAKEALKEFNQRYKEELKREKEKQETKNQLSNGRRRWINREIQNLEEEIEGGSL